MFNWLLARGAGGTFVLRIEDTDFARSTKEAEGSAVDDLRWLGLEVGRRTGRRRRARAVSPVRAAAYLSRARRGADVARAGVSLLLLGRAARDGSLPGAAQHAAAEVCRPLPQYPRDDARARVEAGEPAVIRFRVPDGDREIAFDDLVRGRVSFMTDVIGDFVLVRSGRRSRLQLRRRDRRCADGDQPRDPRRGSHLQHAAAAAAVRGVRVEAAALRPRLDGAGPDHSKLSKRHGATSVGEFRERGYLPEAVANYLALLGWSPGDNEELLPLGELARRFRIEDVGKSAGVFDPEKLAWVNRHYLKLASPERLIELTLPFIERQGWVVSNESDRDSGVGIRDSKAHEFLAHAVAMLRNRSITSTRCRHGCIFCSIIRLPRRWPIRRSAPKLLEARSVIAALGEETARSGPLVDKEAFRAMAARIRQQTGAKGKALFHPIRLALTGEAEGLELDLAVPLIEQGAALTPSSGIRAILNAANRAAAFLHELEKSGVDA